MNQCNIVNLILSNFQLKSAIENATEIAIKLSQNYNLQC